MIWIGGAGVVTAIDDGDDDDIVDDPDDVDDDDCCHASAMATVVHASRSCPNLTAKFYGENISVANSERLVSCDAGMFTLC